MDPDPEFHKRYSTPWMPVSPNVLIRPFTAMEFLAHGKEKPIVKVENISNSKQMIRNGAIKKKLKSQTQSTDFNLRSRCRGGSKNKVVTQAVAPRVQARK
ncbi:hypothetical protein AVEN_117548-1 [Araneus ventricosus]|uniref:Uncharacterized protein n=1 Tax=Araneus ventricosus TaxID=182803 RepID=A0A4Y2IJY3_ARAVE|nr:hypothetical protein AVEN_117548-1 [Araneus ventricosus]